MGSDGGSTRQRKDVVSVSSRGEEERKAQRAEAVAAREAATTCALTHEPLGAPVVAGPLGRLFNKAPLLEALILKTLPPVFSHISKAKHLRDLVLDPPASPTEPPVAHVCPISLVAMDGTRSFAALPCGHVFALSAFDAVDAAGSCFVCGASFTPSPSPSSSSSSLSLLQDRLIPDVLVLNPRGEAARARREEWEAAKAAAKAKRKAAKKGKVVKKGTAAKKGKGKVGSKRARQDEGGEGEEVPKRLKNLATVGQATA